MSCSTCQQSWFWGLTPARSPDTHSKMQGICGSAYRFVPYGFILPLDASKFAAEYRVQQEKDAGTVWICKVRPQKCAFAAAVDRSRHYHCG